MNNDTCPITVRPKTGKQTPDLLKLVPEWFLATTAFIYATGFLVVSFFHDSYGLHGLDETILKVKYAHVGILCLAIPVVIGTAAYALFEFRARKCEAFKTYLAANHVEDRAISRAMRLRWVLRRQLYNMATSLLHYRKLSHLGLRLQHLAEGSLGSARFALMLKIEDVVLETLKDRLNPSLTFTLSMMALIMYIELIFAPSGQFRSGVTQGILVATVVCAYFLRTIAMRYHYEGNEPKYRMWRLIQALALSLFLVGAVLQCIQTFCELCLPAEWNKWPVGLWYIALPGLLGFQISKIRERIKRTEIGQGKRLWLGLTVGVVGLFYFFNVVVFGYTVFHYIPAGKGGGDFSSASLIKIELADDSKIHLSPVLSTNNPEKELILIEGTGSSIFVANPADRSGPNEWRKGRDHRPQVVEIPRSQIGTILYTGHTYDDWKEVRNEKARGNIVNRAPGQTGNTAGSLPLKNTPASSGSKTNR